LATAVATLAEEIPDPEQPGPGVLVRLDHVAIGAGEGAITCEVHFPRNLAADFLQYTYEQPEMKQK
jgi:hypothetical protein